MVLNLEFIAFITTLHTIIAWQPLPKIKEASTMKGTGILHPCMKMMEVSESSFDYVHLQQQQQRLDGDK